MVGPHTAVSSWAVTMTVRSVLTGDLPSCRRRRAAGRRPARRTPPRCARAATVRAAPRDRRRASAGSASTSRIAADVGVGVLHLAHRPGVVVPQHLAGAADQAAHDGDAGHRHLEQLAGYAVPRRGVEPHVRLRQLELGDVAVAPLQADVVGHLDPCGPASAPPRPTSGSRRRASAARPRAAMSTRFCRSQRPAQKTCGRRAGSGARRRDDGHRPDRPGPRRTCRRSAPSGPSLCRSTQPVRRGSRCR